MLCDFYGNVLVEPTTVEHQRGQLALTVAQICECARQRVCNPHYRALAALWSGQGQDPRHIRVKIATRFTRLVFQLVSGRQVLRHPSMRGRDAILDKLMKFQLDHRTSMTTLMSNLQEAVAQLPAGSHAEEAAPLLQALKKVQASRRGVKPIGEILPLVLARLGVGDLQSTVARESS
jgi:hypothetical protein